jgi:predicted metal-binding membrane protein
VPVERLIYWTAAAVFFLCAGATLYFVHTMSGGMAMPGGWTMSMMWMRMPGQGWGGAGVMFVAMWVAMMIAMMLPSALPMLLLYRRVLGFRGDASLGLATWSLGAGYFAVWLAFGAVAYVVGAVVAQGAIRFETVSRAVPAASGVALVVAGIYQLTPWKTACLRHCRNPTQLMSGHLGRRGWRDALSLGLHHGTFCAGCCCGLMLVQLVLGVMSIGTMVLVAAVIAAEKTLASGVGIARTVGGAAVLAGAGMVLRALFK